MQDFEHSSDDTDTVEIAIRPPKLFLGGLAAAAFLELIWPIGPGLAQGSWKPWVIGLAIAALGAVIGVRAVGGFNAAETSYHFDDPTDALVTGGLHGISRNAIYIGLIVGYFGIALALTSGWAMLAFPVLVTILHKKVVFREEEFLEGKFGDNYRAYKEKVPRWL